MGVMDEAEPGASGVEIERRWLLDGMPSQEELGELGARRVEIEQVYLTGTAGMSARRVRRATDGDGTRFVLTVKEGAGRVRTERGSEIDAATYDRLVGSEADPDRMPIRKSRHLLDAGRQVLEVDDFEQPGGIVLLEVELESEDEPLEPWPAAISRRVVREVTDDAAYQNVNLALRR